MIEILDEVQKSLLLPKCSFSNEDLIQILKEMNQISRVQISNEVYEVFIRHPNTLEILLELLSRDHEIEYVIPLLTQTCYIFTNLSYDELICKQMFQKIDVLNLVNNLLRKYFLTNYFGEIDLFRGQNFAQIKKILTFMDDMIWMANNLIAHEINYHQTTRAIEIGLAETY